MQIEHSITIKADMRIVWDIFTDLTCWKNWNTVAEDLTSDSRTLTEGKYFKFCIRPFAFPLYIEPVVEAVRECSYIVWSGSKHGIHARHEFIFTESAEGVLLTSRETFSAGVFKKILVYFSKGKVHTLSIKMLEELKEAAENGKGN